MQDKHFFGNFSIVARVILVDIHDSECSVNIDVRSHFLNLLIAANLLPHSQFVTGNMQPICNMTKIIEKQLDLSQSCLTFFLVLKRLLRLKRLTLIYIFEYVNFQAIQFS